MNAAIDPGPGERIRRFREIRGLTRAALAHKLQVEERELQAVEEGKMVMPPQWAASLQAVFGVDPGWLLGAASEGST